MIYFDNAATSWPKPPCVGETMVEFFQTAQGNPGRSSHRCSLEAGRALYDVRETLAEVFNAPDPLSIVFTFNVTDSINLAMRGLIRPGHHIVTSTMEHNAVTRPLRAMEQQGVEVTMVQASPEGFLDPKDVEAALRDDTFMIVLNHASNVVGSLMPIREIGRIARERDVLFLVDAAQTAGAYPIDVEADCIDLLAFTGHKALYGPTGTGGLVIGERVDLDAFEPLRRGGTGSGSERDEQPEFLPDKFESGTANVVCIEAMGRSTRWVLDQGIDAIRRHEMQLLKQMLDGLAEIPEVSVYGSRETERQTAVVSFNIGRMHPSEAGMRLDEDFGIMCRVGLHCAPFAHRTIGTFPNGTVRFGLGAFNTAEEVEQGLRAVKHLAVGG